MRITKHAKERMAERGITPKEVDSVLKAKETKYIVSDSQNDVLKAINAKENLTVVFAPAKQTVITVYKTKSTKRSKP